MKHILALLLFTPSLLLAELKVPHFFSDHMVLQRERAAAIWGKADAGGGGDGVLQREVGDGQSGGGWQVAGGD